MVYICLFWDSGLQKLAPSVDREPWFKRKLKEYFCGTPYEGIFDPPWCCTVAKKDYVWKPVKTKCPTFVDAINTCIWLTEHVHRKDIKEFLYVYLDRNMQNIYEVDHLGTCTFEETDDSYIIDKYIPRVIMDVMPPAKPMKDKDKILHTLSKALPQRCQIRNLKDIIINYATEDDNFFAFLLAVIRASLFGTYRHCKEHLNFEGRAVLHKCFYTQLSSKQFFIKWFRNGNDHQVLIFFCLKEYLLHCIREASPVYEIVNELYGWEKFDVQVRNYMDKIRSLLSTIAKREYTHLHKSDWITSVETVLLNAAKSHVKLFRTTPQQHYYNKIQTLLLKYFTQKKVYKVYDIIPTKSTQFIWSVMQRLQNLKNIFKIMHLFDISNEVAEKLTQETFGPEDFSKQSDKTLKYIIEFCRLVNLRKNIGFYVLPDHIFEAQKKALQEREELTTLTNKDLNILSINYVCLICQDVKMFLMKSNANHNRHSNKLAKGSLRVIVNNCGENLQLEYVCGRRTERHQRHGKRKWRDDSKVAERKVTKEKQREAVAHRCVNTQLQEVSMFGHCLRFFNKMIVVCTNCGNTCLVDSNSYHQATMLNCALCVASNKKKCVKCSNEVVCNQVLALDRKTGRFRKADLCQACCAIYATKQPMLL
jgi:hypothetical protein